MMLVKYFKGLAYQPSKFGNGLYMLNRGRDSWYCCTYNNYRYNKKAILAESKGIAEEDLSLIQKPGIVRHDPSPVSWDDNSRHWQFHHVIEKHNLSDLPLEAMGLPSLNYYHRFIVPTVMVHHVEHQQSFTNAFDVEELREMYVHDHASHAENTRDRVQENNLLYQAGKYTLGDAIDTTRRMAHFYIETYDFHREPILKTIARNFFEELIGDMKKVESQEKQ